jgi:hypothetical protein
MDDRSQESFESSEHGKIIARKFNLSTSHILSKTNPKFKKKKKKQNKKSTNSSIGTFTNPSFENR